MTKSELIRVIVQRTGLPRKAVARVIDVMTHEVLLQVKRGERVKLQGFASFVPTIMGKRLGVDLNTGERVVHEERASIGLRPSLETRRFLNQK